MDDPRPVSNTMRLSQRPPWAEPSKLRGFVLCVTALGCFLPQGRRLQVGLAGGRQTHSSIPACPRPWPREPFLLDLSLFRWSCGGQETSASRFPHLAFPPVGVAVPPFQQQEPVSALPQASHTATRAESNSDMVTSPAWSPTYLTLAPVKASSEIHKAARFLARAPP